MNDLLLEGARTLIVPILIALITIYFSNKINESSKEKSEKIEIDKQKDLFYLRLSKLIKSLESYSDLLKDIKDIKSEYDGIKNGEIDFSPIDYEGTSEQDYLDSLFSVYQDKKEFSTLDKIKEIHENYGSLKSCSIDKINSKERFECMKVLETGPQIKILIEDLPFLIELSDSLKPNYK
ncbi:hypothetical protein [Psychrobacillus psychrotolerans]|uniref:hypothetical protein n=1 Tax=Psychrobacillus psychrotolerans TaxID=126156 RepID=UPI003B014D10